MKTKSPSTASCLSSSPSPASRPFSRPTGDFTPSVTSQVKSQSDFLHRARQDRLGPFLRARRCLSRDGLSLNGAAPFSEPARVILLLSLLRASSKDWVAVQTLAECLPDSRNCDGAFFFLFYFSSRIPVGWAVTRLLLPSMLSLGRRPLLSKAF